MFRRLKRIADIFKSEGIIGGLIWLITTIYHRAIPQKQVIWCTNLTELNGEGFSIPDHINIERLYSLDQLDKRDYKTLTECGTDLMGSAGSIIIRERFDKCAVLWLLKENGQLAGYRWTIVNNHVTPTYFPHTEGDVHSIGAEIFPNFRGRNLLFLFQINSFIIMKNEGFKRFYAETYVWNKQAVRAFLKTNLRKVGIATRFSFFGKNVVIWHDMTGKIECK